MKITRILPLIALFIYFCIPSSAQDKNSVVKSVTVNPNPVKAGHALTITAELPGKLKKIKSVEIFSREYGDQAPEMKMTPAGDKSQNVWSFDLELPDDVPAGTYNLELKVVNKRGKALVSDSCIKCIYGKAAEFTITIID